MAHVGKEMVRYTLVVWDQPMGLQKPELIYFEFDAIFFTIASTSLRSLSFRLVA